jgi:phage gpG-like protein
MRPLIEFTEIVRKFGESAERLPEEIKPFLIREVQKNIDRAKEPRNAPLTLKVKGRKPPLRDRGYLRTSIAGKVEGLKVIAGTNLRYAPIQHFGGTITPKRAKSLVIPANGKVKKEVETLGVRGYLEKLEREGWEIAFRKRAILGIPPAKRKKAKPKLLFVRKEEVTIPARPFMYLTEEQLRELQELAERILFEELS